MLTLYILCICWSG